MAYALFCYSGVYYDPFLVAQAQAAQAAQADNNYRLQVRAKFESG